jgi:hypothetical protein
MTLCVSRRAVAHSRYRCEEMKWWWRKREPPVYHHVHLENGVADDRISILPLARAATAGDFVGDGRLVKRGNTQSITSAMVSAASSGHYLVVLNLVEAGAEVNAVNREGVTPLMLAASKGRQDVVRYLCEKGANINASGANGETALILSASQAHLEVTRHLIQLSADVNAADKNGVTVLMRAASIQHHFAPHRAGFDAGGSNEDSPFVRAVRNSHLGVVRLLWQHEVNVNAADARG